MDPSDWSPAFTAEASIAPKDFLLSPTNPLSSRNSNNPAHGSFGPRRAHGSYICRPADDADNRGRVSNPNKTLGGLAGRFVIKQLIQNLHTVAVLQPDFRSTLPDTMSHTLSKDIHVQAAAST
jgi:hypothetical protein